MMARRIFAAIAFTSLAMHSSAAPAQAASNDEPLVYQIASCSHGGRRN